VSWPFLDLCRLEPCGSGSDLVPVVVAAQRSPQSERLERGQELVKHELRMS
jgi:hypothetical protein